MPVVMPSVVGNLGFHESGFKPPAAIRARTWTWEHSISRCVRDLRLLNLQCIQSHTVERHIACRTILRLCQPDHLPLEINLLPRQRVLLSPTHPRIDADDEGWNLFWIAPCNDCPHIPVLV